MTSIGKYMFSDTVGIMEAVYISDIAAWCNIEFGDNRLLYYAHNLYLNNVLVTDLVIPNTVTTIKNRTFEGATCLQSVTIPNSVTSIGEYAFDGCSGLKGVYISDIAAWCNIVFGSGASNPLFYAHNLYLNNILVTDLVIPNTVTAIKNYAFEGASCLQSVTIPDSVTSIGYSAFDRCSRLTSVTIGNSVTSIGYDAFYECSKLTSITIGNSVTSIGYDAFDGCTGLTSVYISDIAAWCNIEFGSSASNPLYYAHNLYLNNVLVTDLVIPNSVTTIKYRAFDGASCLQSITISDSVTSIGSYAFAWCSGLTRIDFNGTKEQWIAISKGIDWTYMTAMFTVYCTDGEISKADS